MTERVEHLLEQINNREYRKLRDPASVCDFGVTEYDFLSIHKAIKKVFDVERCIIYENDRFGFNRGNARAQFHSTYGNLTPGYARLLSNGLDKTVETIKMAMEKTTDKEKLAFGEAMLESVEIIYKKCDEYAAYAKEKGVNELYEALQIVPRKPARTFYEACVFVKLIIYSMRLAFMTHVTIGRFDQYMYPYFLNDLKKGKTKEELFELVEEFFLSLNRDTDLFYGVQQGDNGQSMVLGGYDKDGKCMYNELSEMCMKASLELKLIDPKINLRVNKDTPDELYILGTQLTKAGLGFPQYCNDDIIVPGLVKLGYDYEDALDYSVAACWEPIIPDKGADVPNFCTMDFPRVANQAIIDKLEECDSFDELMKQVDVYIEKECDRLIDDTKYRCYADGANIYCTGTNAFLSLFFEGCDEKLLDANRGGAKYRNIGCHGAGISVATDSLAAVKKNVYDEKTVSKKELIKALKTNYESMSQVQNIMRNSHHMGNDEDYVDDIACNLLKTFSENMNNRPHEFGGIYRAGTGSAQEYFYTARKCPATANGRKAGETYSANYSPAPGAKSNGLLSCIQSFTKFDHVNTINGGPFTVEIHDTVLRNDEGIKKTAMLVKLFIQRGGHQMQLNALNKETLLDAKQHPENHKNLIVRVWGWSGYFNELEEPFQNHVINRIDYSY